MTDTKQQREIELERPVVRLWEVFGSPDARLDECSWASAGAALAAVVVIDTHAVA